MSMIIDTHIHVVPGVDDGAQSIKESLEMLKMEKAQGVSYIIATPHSDAFDYYVEETRNSFNLLCTIVRDMGLGLRLQLGCEVYCSPSNIDDCINKLQKKIYPTIGSYVLIEFSTHSTNIDDATLCVERLLKAGYIPVLAHVERYNFSNIDNIAKLKSLGACIQINAFSLTESASYKTRLIATELIKREMADFIGSDAHRLNHRPPVVAEGIKRILELASDKYCERLLQGELLFE